MFVYSFSKKHVEDISYAGDKPLRGLHAVLVSVKFIMYNAPFLAGSISGSHSPVEVSLDKIPNPKLILMAVPLVCEYVWVSFVLL